MKKTYKKAVKEENIPHVGEGGYMPAGSDRYPILVTSVSPDLREVAFVEVDCDRLDSNGQSESQEYGNWRPKMPLEPQIARRSTNGRYYTKGGKTKGRLIVPFGGFAKYLDPSF